MASCTSVLGLVLLVTSLVAAGVGFGTQFWVEAKNQDKDNFFHAGLWQRCEGTKCTPLYNGNYTTTTIPDWFQAVRIGLTVSVGTLALALVIAMSYLCCHCCYFSIKVVQFNIILIFLACIETLGAVTVYALKYHDVLFMTKEQDLRLGWSFYVVCAAGGSLLLNAFFYVCETSHTRTREGYQPITPTSMS